MTRYRLKDQELQKQLDAISDGDFSRQLNYQSLDGLSPDFTFRVRFGGQVGNCFRYSTVFRVAEILIQKEYDPDDWNDFPDVTPPENVLMRVETTTGSKFCGYYHTFAEGGFWCYEDRTVCPEATSKSVKRFRPWE